MYSSSSSCSSSETSSCCRYCMELFNKTIVLSNKTPWIVDSFHSDEIVSSRWSIWPCDCLFQPICQKCFVEEIHIQWQNAFGNGDGFLLKCPSCYYTYADLGKIVDMWGIEKHQLPIDFQDTNTAQFFEQDSWLTHQMVSKERREQLFQSDIELKKISPLISTYNSNQITITIPRFQAYLVLLFLHQFTISPFTTYALETITSWFITFVGIGLLLTHLAICFHLAFCCAKFMELYHQWNNVWLHHQKQNANGMRPERVRYFLDEQSPVLLQPFPFSFNPILYQQQINERKVAIKNQCKTLSLIAQQFQGMFWSMFVILGISSSHFLLLLLNDHSSLINWFNFMTFVYSLSWLLICFVVWNPTVETILSTYPGGLHQEWLPVTPIPDCINNTLMLNKKFVSNQWLKVRVPFFLNQRHPHLGKLVIELEYCV